MNLLLWFQAFLQGIVEGLTEFLPVSSTGHMIILNHFFPMENPVFAQKFEVIIQLGAILSVLVCFYQKILPKRWNIDGFVQIFPLWIRIVVGVLPAAVIGLICHDFIEEKLFNPLVVAVALIVWGIVLIFTKRLEANSSKKVTAIDKMAYWQIICVGFSQCLAMIPGTSRSAVTIIAAISLGCTRACAAEFSFFLAIPTMFGATLLTLVKGETAFSSAEWYALGIGFATAFFTAWGVIAWFMTYVKKHDFSLFGWYRIVWGIILLILL